MEFSSSLSTTSKFRYDGAYNLLLILLGNIIHKHINCMTVIDTYFGFVSVILELILLQCIKELHKGVSYHLAFPVPIFKSFQDGTFWSFEFKQTVVWTNHFFLQRINWVQSIGVSGLYDLAEPIGVDLTISIGVVQIASSSTMLVERVPHAR